MMTMIFVAILTFFSTVLMWFAISDEPRPGLVSIWTLLLAILLTLIPPRPVAAQGLSLGGHYAAEGEHPHVFFTVELRSPSFGPLTVAATHAALKPSTGSAPVLDRTDFTVLVAPDWTVAPVLVGGMEVSRVWVAGGGPCGGPSPSPPCPTEWYTGGVLGIGLTAEVAGGRVDVRYLRHPAATTARGALVLLMGVDL